MAKPEFIYPLTLFQCFLCQVLLFFFASPMTPSLLNLSSVFLMSLHVGIKVFPNNCGRAPFPYHRSIINYLWNKWPLCTLPLQALVYFQDFLKRLPTVHRSLLQLLMLVLEIRFGCIHFASGLIHSKHMRNCIPSVFMILSVTLFGSNKAISCKHFCT